MSAQKNTEENITSENAKADKDCKNMVLHKEIVDGRVSSNKERSTKERRRISLSS